MRSRLASQGPGVASLALVAAAAACSSGGGATGSSSAAAPSACAYPSGPYGTTVGAVVDPSLAWQGYVDDSAQATTVSLRDDYDCDGTRGIRAILIDESATWCPDCQADSEQMTSLAGGEWKSEGVALVVLMAQDLQENPATLDTALEWRNEYALTTGAVCADPQWTTKLWGGASAAGNGFPTHVVVDPRTMKIVAIEPADLQGTLANLSRANGG